MLDQLPLIWEFFVGIVNQYWGLVTTCGILSAFFALKVLDKIFHIFDIIRR